MGSPSNLSFQKVDLAHPLFSGVFLRDNVSRRGTRPVASPHVRAALTPGGARLTGHLVMLSTGPAFLWKYPSRTAGSSLSAVEAGMTWSDFPMERGCLLPCSTGRYSLRPPRQTGALRSMWESRSNALPGCMTAFREPSSFSHNRRALRKKSSPNTGAPQRSQSSVPPPPRRPECMCSTAPEKHLHEERPGRAEKAGTSGADGGKALGAAAVNVDPAETDLRPADDARIQRFWTSLRRLPPREPREPSAASQQLDTTVQESLWRRALEAFPRSASLVLGLAEMAVGRASGETVVPRNGSVQRRTPASVGRAMDVRERD